MNAPVQSGPGKARNLAHNSLWMFAGQGLSVVAQALYFALIGRLLGSAGYGVIVGATAAVSILSQYTSLGSGIVLVQHVSRKRSAFASYWGSALVSLSSLSVVILCVIVGLAPWIVGRGNAATLGILAISDVLFAQLCSLCSQAFQAHERMRNAALIGTSTYSLRLAVAATLYWRWRQVTPEQWALATLVVSACAAIASVAAVTKAFGRPVLNFRDAVRRSREGIVYAFSNSTTSAYNDLDKAMLIHYQMSAATGIYSMAYRVVDVGTIPIRAIHSAAFPRFFQKGAQGISSVRKFAAKILSRTLPISLLACVGMFITAPLLPWIAGPNFSPSIAALRWLCLIPIFRAFHLSAGDALVGAGFKKTRLCSQIAAASFNLGLNILLIPRFTWRGAAWASLATDGGLAVTMWVLLAFVQRTPDQALASPRHTSMSAVGGLA
jgi:O-antigen/teichoic acid export membrane protein